MAFDRTVTLARCCLEAVPIEDCDVAWTYLISTAFCSVSATTVTDGGVDQECLTLVHVL